MKHTLFSYFFTLCSIPKSVVCWFFFLSGSSSNFLLPWWIVATGEFYHMQKYFSAIFCTACGHKKNLIHRNISAQNLELCMQWFSLFSVASNLVAVSKSTDIFVVEPKLFPIQLFQVYRINDSTWECMFVCVYTEGQHKNAIENFILFYFSCVVVFFVLLQDRENM